MSHQNRKSGWLVENKLGASDAPLDERGDTLVSRDGVELDYRVYHVPPRLLTGDEMLLELATYERDGRWLILDAGLAYGRGPEGTLYGKPEVHATLAQIVETLDLRGLL